MHKHFLVALDALRDKKQGVLEIEPDGLQALFHFKVTGVLDIQQHRGVVQQCAQCSNEWQIQHPIPNYLVRL
jgi:hypothetical protein